MVGSIPGSQSPDILAGLSKPQATPSGSTPSFTEQLVAALEGYLEQAGNGSHLEIDIQATQSQNSGVRQFLVTVKDPDSAPAQNPSAATNPLAPGPAAAPLAASDSGGAPNSESAPADEMTRGDLVRAEIDAYWAAQPPAVQKLRDMHYSERGALAQQLADQGYIIDKAIMVWGWDPLKTMLTRQMHGYTWAPSLNQGLVSTPGLALPSQTPYDPNKPPAGSIAVNTDFAKGLKIADPWA